MNFDNKFKRNWWIIILVFLSLLLLINKLGFQLLNTKNENYEIILFLIWICLLLIPLFSEIVLFGVKLKKDIDEVKTKIVELKTDLINNNIINQTLIFRPSKDEDLEKRIEQEKAKTSFKDKGSMESETEIENYLFQLRKAIEVELRRIFANHSEFDVNEIRLESISSFLQNLKAKGIIVGKLFGAIKELVAISNLSIHGHQISEKQIYFANIFGPKVIEELKEID